MKTTIACLLLMSIALPGCGDGDQEEPPRFMIQPGELNPKYADSGRHIFVERPSEGCPVGPVVISPHPCAVLSLAESVFVARVDQDSIRFIENPDPECRGEREGYTIQVEVVGALWGEPVPNLMTVAVPSTSIVVNNGFWSEYALVKTIRFKGYNTSFGSYAATVGSEEEINTLSSWGPTLPKEFDRLVQFFKNHAQTCQLNPPSTSICQACYACDPPREPYVTPYCQRPGNADKLCCRDDTIMCAEE